MLLQEKYFLLNKPILNNACILQTAEMRTSETKTKQMLQLKFTGTNGDGRKYMKLKNVHNTITENASSILRYKLHST